MTVHLIPIFVVAAFALAIVLERAFVLYILYPFNANRFLAELKQRVLSNDISGAIQFCSDQGSSLGAKVAKAGFLRASRDNEQIANAIEIAAHDASGRIRKRVGYLSMFANVATLFGLLGTIFGLIKSFAAVANVDAATKSILLAEGISISMNATASGLAVAIPAMIAFSVLQSRSNRLVEQVENVAMTINDLLSARAYREEWDTLDKKPEISIVPEIEQEKEVV